MASISETLAARRAPASPPLDYYASAEAWRSSATTTLADVIAAIRGESYTEKVEAIRALIDAGELDQANALKKSLPAISLSGSVEGRRRKAAEEGRFQHSGLLQIDLDGKDNPDFTLSEMRELLLADAHIVAIFESPSGTGIKGIARIPADAATHKESFTVAELHYAALGLTIDKSCKDPIRLCFVSSDPDAWIRPISEAVEFIPVAAENTVPTVEALPLIDPEDDEETDTPEREAHRNTPNQTSISPTGGLIIRGGRPPLDAATVRDMLRVIPHNTYDDWLRIANAVWHALGESEGTALLQAWSPEKNPGDYASHFQHKLADVTSGTLFHYAQQHGWAPPSPPSSSAPVKPTPKPTISALIKQKSETGIPVSESPHDPNSIPPHVFPVPSGAVGYDLAARHIFALIAPTRRLLMRGTTVHEIARDSEGIHHLNPIDAQRFASEIETFGPRVMRRDLREDGRTQWKPTTLVTSSAAVLLASSGARQALPAIRQVVSAPVIVRKPDGGSEVLEQGWHPHGGGTFVTSKAKIPTIPLAEAIEIIVGLIQDFEFTAPGDCSRAVASIISPALKTGGWINDDFPLDLAEADQSQAGKTYRQKLILAIYRESPSVITNSTGGVGSLDERVAAALIAGRPFITMENFRGRMDSQTLESAIRGQGRVTARALRQSIDVDCSPFLWQLSTNGAELTRDLANRSIITRIRKRPEALIFTQYPEGLILQHVEANQPRHLGAVHAIIREWERLGCQSTDESRHDFRTWCRALDWIVQNIFGLPPLLEGHREEQLRTANPKLQWLRDVINATIEDGYEGHGLTASDLNDTAEHHDFSLPGKRNQNDNPEATIGKVLGRLFRDADSESLSIDGRIFTRQITIESDPVNSKTRERKIYVIETIPQPTQ